MNIRRLHSAFGACLSDVKITGHMQVDNLSQIKNALEAFQVLYLPQQEIDDEIHLAFTQHFGKPEYNIAKKKKRHNRLFRHSR